MRPLSSTELERMRDTAESSFMDSCKLGTPSGSGFNSDPGSTSYSWGSEIACGFDANPAGEAEGGSQAPVVDAMLRLPIGTTVTEEYRVRITKRHGEALGTPEEYTIDGAPDRGVSALVLKLKYVAGASSR
jgi:hypothetical protein